MTNPAGFQVYILKIGHWENILQKIEVDLSVLVYNFPVLAFRCYVL